MIDKNIFLILVIFLQFNLVNAQKAFEVPQYTKAISKQDSVKIENDLLVVSNWLIESDLDKEPEKRKKANAFVLQWYIDNITLNITLVEKLAEINEGNADLLLVYFAGFSKYYIKNKKDFSKLNATRSGLTSVLQVYNKGLNVTKSGGLDKLTKINAENKLDDFIKENFLKD